MFVKICGITSLDDAMSAVEYGANAIGFNFYTESRRYITPEDARAIVRELPETVRKVGVFVNADAETVKKIASQLLLDFVQFHGEESVEYVRGFGSQAIKAFRTSPDFDPAIVAAYNTTLSIIDAYDLDRFGGTGMTADWDAAKAATQYGRILLAGGLTPANVEEAIMRAAPFGVDVAGGIETSPGKKDHAKMKEFIEKARQAKSDAAPGAGR